jgi:pimeloyl-ACP methyl ester carboxylesterase
MLLVKIVSALLLIAAGSALWVLLKRPLWVWNQAARRALKAAGLSRQTLASAAGEQVFFVGGSGPVLLLLHGAGDHAGSWSRVAPALLTDHTLVIPDLAGHGESAPATGLIEVATVIAGLEALLASQFPERQLTVVGNSLGAWMALVLAQRHPDRVAKVVAVNGGSLPGSGSTVNLLPTTREEARATLAALRHPDSPAVPDIVLDDMVRQRSSSPLARFAASAASMGAWIMGEEQLRALTTPVRLLWGEADQLMPLDYARRLQALLADAQLIPIERCGHVPHQEAPERFLAALRQAL